MTHNIYYYFSRNIRGAQIRIPFDLTARARAPIFNLSWSDIYEKEILNSSLYFLMWKKKIFSFL